MPGAETQDLLLDYIHMYQHKGVQKIGKQLKEDCELKIFITGFFVKAKSIKCTKSLPLASEGGKMMSLN